MTNIANIHTCTIGCEDLVISVVLVSGGKFVLLPGNMICCCRIGVPICMNSIVVHSFTNTLGVVVVGSVCLIKPMPAIYSKVPDFPQT
jgi:hypothetical protein